MLALLWYGLPNENNLHGRDCLMLCAHLPTPDVKVHVRVLLRWLSAFNVGLGDYMPAPQLVEGVVCGPLIQTSNGESNTFVAHLSTTRLSCHHHVLMIPNSEHYL